ncbi:SPFH domain-containing protein [Streptomyces sp. NPDC057552]|uniref:SPFH domain-containing protein n=1 Tax=Streptomyces sp. NPDC057552 TaxID=3350537 RepID=UPI00367570CA
MTERNREPVTPDQNPQPQRLTDHDPRGETPMPLIDDVALHPAPHATLPPLFRPKEEGPSVADPGPGAGADPGAGSDPGPGLGQGLDPVEGLGRVGEPWSVGGKVGVPGPGAVPEVDEVGTSGAGPELNLMGEEVGAPAPAPASAPGTGEGGDSGPSLGLGSGPGPGRDLGSDPDPGQDPGLGPRPVSEPSPDLDPRPTPGSSPDPALRPASKPSPDLHPDPTSAPSPDPAPRPTPESSPAPDPRPASEPDTPGKPVRLDHPGRSLHLEPGAPHVRSVRPEEGPGAAVPSDGPPRFQPVRRLRTDPSAEWTPLPAYGEEAGPRPKPVSDARTDRGPGAPSAQAGDLGPDTELDLVLDLAPGARATSATFSVPGPQPPPHPRRHSVILNESTASIPVHLLFRDDPETPEPTALPTAVAHRTGTGPGHRTGTGPADRTPRPRSPHPRVEPPTRPAPLADPRLAERPGPALSGYAALLAGAAGLLGVLALLWWRGALPAAVQGAVGLVPRPYEGIGAGAWAGLALLAAFVVLALGGLGRGRVGYAWVLTLFGDYRGSVRRTGLVWVSPLLLRRRVDVRLRHWRSEPLPAVDANGTALRVVVLVVWRIKDTVRAALGIEDHEAYLRAQVESAMARVLSQLPADAFHEDAPTLRDAEAVGDALTRMLKADCEPVGVEVYSAQPTGIEYAPEVAAAMQRRRIAAIDAKHRDSVLTSVVDAVDDTVNRLTTRGIVELDDYERKALVKDLTVAFYTGRSGGGDGA